MIKGNRNKNFLIKLNKFLSKGYEIADQNFYNSFSVSNKLKKDSALIITRRIFPVIIQLFFIKVLKVYSNKKLQKRDVEIKGLNLSFNTIQELENKLVDENFNFTIDQFIHDHIYKKRLNKKKLASSSKKVFVPLYKNNLYQINEMILSKILIKLEYYIFKYVPFFSRIPTLHLSQMSGIFFKKGWFIFFLKNLDYDFISNYKSYDIKERNLILKKLLPSKYFKDFQSEFNLDIKNKTILEKLFNQFMINLFPTTFLENFYLNFTKANKILKGSKSKIVISSGCFSTSNIFLLCAAKENDFKLVNIQHGGLEGYVNHIPIYNEIEYVIADTYLSWGWSKISTNKGLNILPISSPWLSERKLLFKRNKKVNLNDKIDVLYMPRKAINLRTTPYGRNNVIESDLIYSKIDFLNIINSLENNKFSSVCKFYDIHSSKFYKKVIENEKNNYKIVNFSLSLEKGISRNMVNNHKLILWDLPGTGFLECIACNIPTICCNNSNVMKINKCSQSFFDELKSVGVYCESIDDMNLFIKNFLKNPEEWITNKKRNLVLKKISYIFARVEKDWSKEWLKTIKSIAKNNNV